MKTTIKEILKWKCVNCGEEIKQGESLCEDCKVKFAEEEDKYTSCQCCGTSIELGKNLCDKCKGDLHEEYINAGYEAP